MEVNGLFPVLTLMLGWGLNQVESIVKLRRDDRRAAGPVLTDLFEIRHQLMSVDAAMKEIAKHLPIPAQAQLQLQGKRQAGCILCVPLSSGKLTA